MNPSADSSAREKILFYLKTKGPQTAMEIAKRLSVTSMAVRQHLYQLRKQEQVDHEDRRRSVGRPARFWRITEKGERDFPDSHNELAVGLIAAMRAAFGEKGMQRLVEERARAQFDAYARELRGTENSLDKRVSSLAQIRRREGYMAECNENRDGSVTLMENHCPICSAAKVCQGLCDSELDLFRRLMGADINIERQEHILSGARRCAYVFRRKN